MNLVRKLKINKVTPIEFTETEKGVISFIEDMFKTLTIVKENNSIFFINPDAVIILEENRDDNYDYNYLLVNDDIFWDVLNRRFNLDGDEVADIIHYMAEDFFKMKLSEPTCAGF